MTWKGWDQSRSRSEVQSCFTLQKGSPPVISFARRAPTVVYFRGSNVYVGNLPWSVGTEELKDFMQSAGGEVAHVEVLRDGIGRSKGCGIVRFVNAEQAQNGACARM